MGIGSSCVAELIMIRMSTQFALAILLNETRLYMSWPI